MFNEIFAALSSGDDIPGQLQMDATHLKAHRTAASLLKKRMFLAVLVKTKGGLNSTLFVMIQDAPIILLLSARADE